MFTNGKVDEADLQERQPRFRFWIVISPIVAAGIFAVVVEVAVQNHDERVLTDQMIQTETDLKTTGARIADIKDRKFDSMADYIKRLTRTSKPYSMSTIINCTNTLICAIELKYKMSDG